MFRRFINPFYSAALFATLGLAPSHLFAVEEVTSATDRVVTVDGQKQVLPRWSTEGVANRWPAQYEAEYRQRIAGQLPNYVGKSGVNTTGEREKYDYPLTVGAWIAGDHKQAIGFGTR